MADIPHTKTPKTQNMHQIHQKVLEVKNQNMYNVWPSFSLVWHVFTSHVNQLSTLYITYIPTIPP